MRKNESNQLKCKCLLIVEFRQDHKVLARKIDESEKSCLKILTSFAQLNPEHTHKTNAIISESEASFKKIERENVIVYGKIKKINESVDELRETLKYFDKTNESLMKVQALTENIFGKLDNVRNEMALGFDELQEAADKFSSDLELLDRRIEGFEDQEVEVPIQKAKNKENVSIQNQQKLQKKGISEKQVKQIEPESRLEVIELRLKEKEEEVEKVDELIREQGKFLGWHQEDHKDFLTIWSRGQPHKNYFQIQEELTDYFKMHTGEQIIDHMNKYMKVKKLNEKKKSLIQEYKEIKEQKKAEQIAKLKEVEDDREAVIRKQEHLKKVEMEQKEMKQKVERWKKNKQESKKQQIRMLQEEELRRKEIQNERRREEEFRRKQIIARMKEQKEAEQKQRQERQAKQAPKRPHSAVNKQTRERIREREERTMKQKMEKAISKKMQQEENEKKALHMKQQKMIKYAHVGSKLEEKTTAMKEKEREKFDGKEKKDANTFGGQLLMTGVRAIPSWRQGL